jgi:aspartyl-tRNA(Asn)/glutamyl-tRNA(Gln) amidotransferase subunit C
MTLDITKLGRLARIALSDSDKQLFEQEISGIMKWVEQLQEVNTDNVPALTSVSQMQLRWREDVVSDGNQVDAVLANAPKADYGCFGVPKVIE